MEEGTYSDNTVPERHLIFYSILPCQEFLGHANESIFSHIFQLHLIYHLKQGSFK